MRKLLSFVTINLATFMLLTAFMVWMVDGKLLQPNVLDEALYKNNFYATVSKRLPDLIDSKDSKQNDNQSGNNSGDQSGNGSDGENIDEIKQYISKAADEAYVRAKISGFTANTISFIKTGSPSPSLDLSDFPARLEAANDGLEVPQDFRDQVSKPIDLQKNLKPEIVSNVNSGYEALRTFKLVSPLIIGLLLVVVWAVAPKGRKYRNLRLVFIPVALWSVFYWLILTVGVSYGVRRVSAETGIEVAPSEILTSLMSALVSILAGGFMLFAGLNIALITVLYVMPLATKKLQAAREPSGVSSGKPSQKIAASIDTQNDKPQTNQPANNASSSTHYGADVRPQPSRTQQAPQGRKKI